MEVLKTKKGGFTLIELLIVIGIIVILMAATLVAINPFRQFAIANNGNRWSGVNTILNAVSQRVVDNQGRFAYNEPNFAITDCPATGDDVPAVATAIGSAGGQYDCCTALAPTYTAALPYDPQFGSFGTTCADPYDTDYSISCDSATGRITVCALDSQLGETICVTR